jgi:hypothetical protein
MPEVFRLAISGQSFVWPILEERAFAEGRGPDPATRDAMKDGFIFDDEPLR